MQNQQQILNTWALAVNKDEHIKSKHISLTDLVKKYSDASEQDLEGVLKRSVRPWNHDDFTSRLLTFEKSVAWFAKPEKISALQCARYGWNNKGIDQLYCLSCSATLTHSKDDRDGKCLRELLQHGHDAHCGWKNNGCPTDFLKYPTRSFESLNIEMLQRTRLTLLAIIDFAKRNEGQPANTLMISNASISATTPSSSTSSTSSSKLMRVQVASVIRDTVPDHANWFLLSNASSSSDSTLSSSSIQFSLAECVQSESLLKIASVVKCIDRQIKAYSVGYNVFVGSEEGMDKESQENPLAILDSLLRPISQNIDGTANNSFNSVSIQQIVKTSILMAVTGWTPIATTTTVSLNNTSNTNTIRAEGVVIDGVLIGGRMESSMDSFKCNMCGRCFPLKYLLSDTAVDPLFQHRSFCLWAQYRNDTTTNNIDSKSEEFVSQNDISCEPGWMHCVNAIMNKTSGVSPLILDSVSRRSSLENRVNIDRNGGEISSMALGDGLEYRENAEQVYKKIKLVLDLASTPRIPQQGRFSL